MPDTNSDGYDAKEELRKSLYNIMLVCYTKVYSLQNRLISARFKPLHQKIRSHYAELSKSWKGTMYPCYQGYERIQLKGLRPTEKRIKAYNIGNYLDKSCNLLDIGCNCGFISLELSHSVKSTEGIDINPHLIGIADDTKKFLNIPNAVFKCLRFEDYRPDKRYEIILSLASHETWDNNSEYSLDDYLKKVRSMLAPRGILIFETHDIKKENIAKISSAFKRNFVIETEKKLPRLHPLTVDRQLYIGRKRDETTGDAPETEKQEMIQI